MERNAKRILALVIIAIIATAGIVGAILLINQPEPKWFRTPGAPSGISDSQIIKVGIIGPTSVLQGESMDNGAWLAAKDINEAGGVLVNGTRYYVGVTSEDTRELSPTGTPTDAQNAVQRLLVTKGARYIAGGFRTESVAAYQEDIMDNGNIFSILGAATDNLTSATVSGPNPDRYDSLFRIMPHPATKQGVDVIMFCYAIANIIEQTAFSFENDSGSPYYGCNSSSFGVTDVCILRENLAWTTGFATSISDGLTGLGLSVTQQTFNQDADVSDFTTIWNTIDDTQPQIVIPLISYFSSIYMLEAYHTNRDNLKCLIAGLDVPSSSDQFIDELSSPAVVEGEITSCSGATLGVEYAALSNFSTDYATEFPTFGRPIYTATGAYDFVRSLVVAINETQSLLESALIAEMESWTLFSPLVNQTAASPYLAFDSNHDVVSTYDALVYMAYYSGGDSRPLPYLTETSYNATYNPAYGALAPYFAGYHGFYANFFGQWQSGTLVAVPGGNYDWDLAQSPVQLPSQGLWGAPNA